MKTPNGSPVSSSSPKPRHHRNREPGSATHSSECHSPVRRKSSSPGRPHVVITEDAGPTRHQLWPSTAKRSSGTLADHITEDRIIERTSTANNNTPTTIGGSARHVARFSTPSESKKLSYNNNNIAPGRLSLDENAKSFSSRRHSRNSLELDSDAGKKLTSKKADLEVAKSDATTTPRRARRGTSDSNVANLNGDSSSSVLKRFTLKTAIRRANSLAGTYKSSKTSWALSPGRSESPAMSVESMDKAVSFSSFKVPPTSPTKVKGVEKLLNMGFDLFKGKKSGGFGSLSPVGFGVHSEVVHRLRLLDNRLVQWRFANARAQVVNGNTSHKAQVCMHVHT